MSTESLMVESVKKPTFCGDTKKGKKETRDLLEIK